MMTFRAISEADIHIDNSGATLKRARYDKALACFFYAIVFCIVGTLFYQNFLISSSLGLSGLRDIDDLAFQYVLRKVHLLLLNGDFTGIWQINDYAYGWIYWFSAGVVTFPFYLLSQYAQIDWPLVVFPRQISLLFAVLSLLVMRRLLKRSGVPETGAAAALAIFSLFPTFGYFSMRFGTVNAVMFFSMLSFYFAWNDKPSTERGRLLALLSLAFAGAIKLSGLLIAPLIGGLILVHLSDRSLVGVIRAMLVPSLVFLLALVVFTNPAFLYVPFDEGILTSYVLTLKTFLEIAKRSPEALSPGMLFYHGIFGTAVSAIAICILSIGIFIAGIKEKALRAEIFVLLVSIALIFSYIVLSIHSRASVGSYATAISFLLILGAIGWSRLRIGIGVLTLIALLMAGDAALRAQVPHAPRPDRWGHFSYFDKMQQMDAVLESATFINACIVDLAGKQWGGHLFTDYTLSLTVNNLTNPNVCFSTAWYNLSPSGKYCDRPLDYLVMDKLAPGALPSLKFEKYISQVDEKIAANLRMDRASREGIERDGSFNGQHFEVVCETARLKVFKAAK